MPHVIVKMWPGRSERKKQEIADVAEGYKAMDERRASKTLLRV